MNLNLIKKVSMFVGLSLVEVYRIGLYEIEMKFVDNYDEDIYHLKCFGHWNLFNGQELYSYSRLLPEEIDFTLANTTLGKVISVGYEKEKSLILSFETGLKLELYFINYEKKRWFELIAFPAEKIKRLGGVNVVRVKKINSYQLSLILEDLYKKSKYELTFFSYCSLYKDNFLYAATWQTEEDTELICATDFGRVIEAHIAGRGYELELNFSNGYRLVTDKEGLKTNKLYKLKKIKRKDVSKNKLF